MGHRAAVRLAVGVLCVVGVLASCEVPDPNPTQYLRDDVPGSLTVDETVTCRFQDDVDPGPAVELQPVSTALDVYLPDSDAYPGPRPVVVYLHGGGWFGGSKADIDQGVGLADRIGGAILAQQAIGWVVVSAEYRFSAVAPFPAQVVDAKAAVNCARELGDEVAVEIDQQRVAIAGSSAGGHLATMVGLTPGTWEPKPSGTSADLDGGTTGATEVRAVVNLDGPNDLRGMPVHDTSYDGPFDIGDYVPQLICGDSWFEEGPEGPVRTMCDDFEDRVWEASPLAHLPSGEDNPNPPRIYFACGDTPFHGPLFVECADHRAMYDEVLARYDGSADDRVYFDDTSDNDDNPERPGTSGHHYNIDTHLNLSIMRVFLNS